MIKEDVRKGFTSTIYNYVGLLFEKVVTVFVTVYVIRQLPIAQFGVYNLFQDTVSLVAVIFSFGIPSLIERFLPELYERGLFKDLKKWVYRALVAKLMLGTTGAAICLFGRQWLGDLLNSENFADLFPIFSIGLIFSILNQAAQTILDTFLLQRRRNVIRIVVSMLRAGLYAGALFMGLGLIGILWAFSLSAVFGSALFIWTIVKIKYPKNVQENPDGLGEFTGRLKRYAAYSYFNEMGGMILSRRVDNYMISSYLNTAAVGIYSFATRLVEMFTALSPLKVGTLIISTILFRQFTENPTQEFLQKRFTLLSKLSFYLTLPLLVILIGLRREITTLIDPRYLEAADLLALVAAFETLNCFSYPIAWMAQTTEKVEVQLYSKIGAIYNLISAIILIPRYGPLGAAWATGTSSIIKNALMYIFLRRHLPLKFPWWAITKLSMAGILTYICLEFGSKMLPNAWFAIPFAGAGMIAFVIFSRLLNPFEPSERKAFESALGRKIWII